MEQKRALQLALEGNNIFLTGKAGTGKTYTLNKIIEALKEDGKVVAKTASTGIASTHLGGQTIHSWSATGIKEELIEDDLFKTARNPYAAGRIQGVDVLIIDEISMLKDVKFDVVDEMCRFVRGDRSPFGGMQVITCGDFFQLPPVERTMRTTKSYCFKAKAWNELNFAVCYLDKIYRQSEKNFIDLLNNIRKNEINESQIDLLNSLSRPTEGMYDAVVLYSKNDNVDFLNANELRTIEGETKVFRMEENGKEIPVKILKKNCIAPETLLLKKGAHVMFLKNYLDRKIVNGTQGEIVYFDEYTRYNGKGEIVEEYESIPFVKIFKTGEIEPAYPDKWEMTEFDPKTKKDKTTASVTQVPLKLSWALTIHKSQGTTFDYVNLDLSDVFEEGMGYVALSRATSLDGICLSGFNHKALRVDEEVLEKDAEFLENSKRNEGSL